MRAPPERGAVKHTPRRNRASHCCCTPPSWSLRRGTTAGAWCLGDAAMWPRIISAASEQSCGAAGARKTPTAGSTPDGSSGAEAAQVQS
jgi:hypothetical protein